MPHNITVRELMSRRTDSVSPEDSILHATCALTRLRASSLPVLDSRRHLVGVLSEKDGMVAVMRSAYDDHPGGIVAEYMKSPARSILDTATMLEAAEMFLCLSYRRLPVVDASGWLVGVIRRHDVLEAYIELSTAKRSRGAVQSELPRFGHRPSG